MNTSLFLFTPRNFRRNSTFEQYIPRLCVDSFSWAIINYREHCLLFISCESYSPHPRLYVYIPLLPSGGRAELDQNFDSIEICPEVWWVLEKKCVSHFLEKPQNKTYLLWPGACKGLWVKKLRGITYNPLRALPFLLPLSPGSEAQVAGWGAIEMSGC